MPPGADTHTHATIWRATGHEPPVFHDETGRRGRRMLLVALTSAAVAALWLAGIVGGGIGFSGLPALPGAPTGLDQPASSLTWSATHLRHTRRSAALSASAALIALQRPAHAVHVVLAHPGVAREDAVERFATLQRPGAPAGPAGPALAAAATLTQRS